MKISGRRILLTGASGGLGDAMARSLAAKGGSLTLSARSTDKLVALASDIGAEVDTADLFDRDDVIRLEERCAESDILIANAAVGSDAPVHSMTAEDIDRAIDVNLRAPIQLSRAFVQSHLEADRPGHIVFVGSLAGIVASPDARLYNATKFGLRGYALALRQDLLDAGIGVTLVSPGFIRDAGMFADSGTQLPAVVRTKSPQDVADAVIEGIETNRGEVFVAPVELRLLATLGGAVPRLSSAAQSRLGVTDRRARSRE